MLGKYGLLEGVNPDLAVLLNVHQTHIGNFDSLDQLGKFSISNPDKTGALFVCEGVKPYAPKALAFEILLKVIREFFR